MSKKLVPCQILDDDETETSNEIRKDDELVKITMILICGEINGTEIRPTIFEVKYHCVFEKNKIGANF